MTTSNSDIVGYSVSVSTERTTVLGTLPLGQSILIQGMNDAVHGGHEFRWQLIFAPIPHLHTQYFLAVYSGPVCSVESAEGVRIRSLCTRFRSAVDDEERDNPLFGDRDRRAVIGFNRAVQSGYRVYTVTNCSWGHAGGRATLLVTAMLRYTNDKRLWR